MQYVKKTATDLFLCQLGSFNFTGKSYDERVDIFSFGIMLCEVSFKICSFMGLYGFYLCTKLLFLVASLINLLNPYKPQKTEFRESYQVHQQSVSYVRQSVNKIWRASVFC